MTTASSDPAQAATPARPSRSTHARKDQRRQDILDVASRLFSQSGYENVTLRAIAEEMGFSHPALYRYFPDKSHLLAEICRETFAMLVVEFDAIADASQSPQDALFQTSRGFVRFGLAHPHHFRVVFFGPEDRSGIRVGDYINEIGRPLFERLITIFEACSQSNGLSAETLLLDAHAWWDAIFGMTQVFITQGNTPGLPAPDRVVEQFLKHMWAGLKAAAADSPSPT